MSEHVRIDNSGGVLAITLARPERRNAITVAMYAALADAIEQAPADPSLRLITLAGEGEALELELPKPPGAPPDAPLPPGCDAARSRLDFSPLRSESEARGTAK